MNVHQVYSNRFIFIYLFYKHTCAAIPSKNTDSITPLSFILSKILLGFYEAEFIIRVIFCSPALTPVSHFGMFFFSWLPLVEIPELVPAPLGKPINQRLRTSTPISRWTRQRKSLQFVAIIIYVDKYIHKNNDILI